MKTHTTTTLHNLVVTELDPGNGIMNGERIAEWREKLPCIQKSMYQLFNILMFPRLSDKLINRHFRQVQKECVFLINRLGQYTGVAGEMKELHENVLSVIENILEHIRTYYKEYFNLDVDVPDGIFRQAAEELARRRYPLSESLKQKKAAPALRKLIEDSFDGFQKSKNCSYGRLRYMTELLDTMMNLCETVHHANLTERLEEQLFCLNFNTVAHFRYHVNKVTAETESIFDEQEKYAVMCNYERRFCGYTLVKGSFYSSSNESIRSTLLSYIRAEISCLKKTMKYAIQSRPAMATAGTNKVYIPEEAHKIPLSLTVDALAYLIKLMVASGVIAAVPQMRLLKAVCNCFTTTHIGRKVISTGSLKNKYHEVVHTTKVKVRAILMRMVKTIDQEMS